MRSRRILLLAHVFILVLAAAAWAQRPVAATETNAGGGYASTSEDLARWAKAM